MDVQAQDELIGELRELVQSPGERVGTLEAQLAGDQPPARVPIPDAELTRASASGHLEQGHRLVSGGTR